MKTKQRSIFWIWMAAVLATLQACGQAETDDAVTARQAAFSATGEVLSFETLSGWSTNKGNVSLNPNAVHGNHSLAVSYGGDATLTSIPIGPVSPVDTHLTLDLLQPSTHPNPWWRGTVKIALVSPSLGMYWQELPEVSLQGHPLGQFVRLSFPIPVGVRTQLNSQNPTDLTIKVLLNVPMGAGPWLVDRLSFGTVEEPEPPADDDPPSDDDPPTDDEPDASVPSIPDAGGPDAGDASSPGNGGGPGTSYEFFIRWPANAGLETILLGSYGGDLRVGDSARLIGAGGPSTRANAAAVDGGLTRLGVGSQLQSIWSGTPSHGPMQIANGAHVFGDITTTANSVDVQSGATIDGDVHLNQPLGTIATKTWKVSFPDAHGGSVDVTSSHSPVALAPGAYGELNVSSGGTLVLSSGQYTFESIGAWDASAVTLDNASGPIQVYARNGLTLQGSITRTATDANVLVGFAGDGYAWIQNAANLNFSLVAPWATVTVHPPEGDNVGNVFAKSINADATQDYILEPFIGQDYCSEAMDCSALCPCETGAPCDEDEECKSLQCDPQSGACTCSAGECSTTCPCGGGAGPCDTDADCSEGLICLEGNGPLHNQPTGTSVCVAPICATEPGTPGCYAPHTTCDEDADCPGSQPCLPVGSDYGYTGYAKICVDEVLCNGPDAELFCGQPDSRCGYCDCVPNCQNKQCGDDPHDGCDGLCVGYCPAGSAGCTTNTECAQGTICVEGTCLDASCGTSECDPAVCGDVCEPCLAACAGRQCGTDPECGVSCGDCPNGETCNEGMCELPALDRPEIPAHPGYAVNTSGIGTVPGSFTVSTQGRPNYNIPIDLPPSRGGVRPNIALSYSGTPTPGNAGVGWSLSAGSRIARCPKTATLDGWPDRVKGNSGDAFCLDGQRLVHVAGEPGSNQGAKYRTEVETFNEITHYAGEGGNYWDVRSKDGRLWRYGARLQGFLSTGARNIWPLTYEVNRSGIAIEYGYECRGTLNGTQCLRDPTLVGIEYGGRVVGASSPWGQHHTHRMRLEYENRDDFYRGMTGAPGARQDLTQRLGSIEVEYGGQIVRRYRLGYGEIGSRPDFLTSVTECVEDDAGQETCLGPTTFGYNEPAVPPFAPASQYQTVPGVAATFGGGPVKKNNDQRRAQAGAKHTLLLDSNGDGLVDFLYPDMSNHWSLLLGTGSADEMFDGPYPVNADLRCVTSASIGDFNADGRSDILDGCSEGADVRVWYGTGSTSQPFNPIEYTIAGLEGGSVMFPADMNGDGLTDIVGCETFKPVIALMGPGGTLGPTYDGPNFLQAAAPGVLACNFKNGERLPAPLLLDLDGDGAPNWLIRSGDSVNVLNIEKDPATSQPTFAWQFTGLPTFAHEPRNLLGGPMRVMDINGDGLQDILQHVGWVTSSKKRNDNANPGQIDVTSSLWLNNGGLEFTKFRAYIPNVENGIYEFTDPWLFAPYAGASGELFEIARVLDFDGDGRDDIVTFVNDEQHGGWVVLQDARRTSVDSYLVEFEAAPISGLPTDAAWIEEGSTPMFADFDADGAMDALFFRHEAGEGQFRLIRGTTPARHLLSKVTDGLGNRIEVSYDIDGSSYTPAETCEPHTRCLPRAGVLVDQIATYDADDVLEGHTEFLYEDARVGLYGRGALGFRKRTTTDFNAQGQMIRSTTETYDNGQEYDATSKRYPLAGRLVNTFTITAAVNNGITSAPDGVVPQTSFRTEVDYSYDQLTSDAGRPFVVPRLIVTRQSQLFEGTQVLSRTSVNYAEDGVSSFDQYGNNWFQETRRSGPVSGVGLEVVTVRNWFYPPGQRNPSGAPDPALWEVGLLQAREVESKGKVRRLQFEYDQSTGLLARSVRAPGQAEERVTTLLHDEFGNVRHVRVESDVEFKESDLSYDPYGLRLVSATGPTGLTAYVDQDPATGWVLSEVDANGVASQRVYDRFGRLVQQITPTGDSVTELLPSSETFADYMVRRTTTDGVGAEATTNQSEAHFDSRGRARLTRATGLGGTVIEQRRFYNANGLLESEELPHPAGQTPTGTKTYQYDALGSLRQATVPGDDGEPDVVETYQYGTRYTTPPELMPSTSFDVARTVFVARKFDGDGIATTTFTGPSQEAVARRRGDGAESEETRITYGAYGQVNGYYGASNTLSMSHDDWGRVLSVTDSDIGTVTYSYDAFDRVESMIDGDGRQTTYQYDLLDRLVMAVHPDATERFVFDRDVEAEADGEPQTVNSAGRLVRAVRQTTTGEFTQLFRYQAKPQTGNALNNTALLERVTLDTPSESFETSYEYIPRSARVLVQHYPETTSTQPFGIRYCYDAFGSSTHIFDATAAIDCTSPEVGPAPYWKRTSIQDGLAEDAYQLGNGVEVLLDLDPTTYRLGGHSVMATNQTIGFSYAYEPGGRLESESRSGVGLDFNRDYTYGQSGVLETVTQDGQQIQAASYDEHFRLQGGVQGLGTFSYDSADGVSPGNRLSEVTDDTGSVVATFDYDGRGNQVSRQGSAIAGGEQSITYNDFNLPDTIVTGTGTGASATTVAFDYSATGQRIHTLRATSELWHFADVYEKELRSADPDADELHRYWVFARGKRIAQIERSHRPSDDSWSESSDYLHFDRLGSVIAVSDASGNITSEMSYSVYGEPEQALPTAFGYTGHRHEQDLGLIDARGRFYDPQFGIFLSADPASPLGGGSPRMNRYAYVGYDPVNFTDPTGYFIVPMAIAAWQMYGGLVVAAAWIMPTFNFINTGEFSYDWSKETWKAAATVGTVVLAGSLGFACGVTGGPVLAAMCAGAVSGGLGTALHTSDPGKILAGAVMGTFISLGSAGIGHVVGSGLSIAVQSVSENPYVQAGLITAANSGASIGLQSATGGEIDWVQVASQAAFSGLLAFNRAAEADAAIQQAAAQGAAAGEAYHEASWDGYAEGASGLEAAVELGFTPTDPGAAAGAIACYPACALDLRSLFPNDAAYLAYVEAYLEVGVTMLGFMGGGVGSGAGAAVAARAVPTLATGTGRQMLGQALNVLKATPAEGRVAAMRQLIPQIQARATGGAWSATEMAGANGARAWVGETHTLVIDSAGKVFSGSHVGGAAQFGVVEGQLGVTSWSGLKALF